MNSDMVKPVRGELWVSSQPLKICKVLFSYYKLQIGQNQGYGVNGDILTV